MDYDYYEDRVQNPLVEHLRRISEQIALRRRLRDRSNPFDMSTTEFVSLYRMPQHALLQFVEHIRPYMRRRTNVLQIPVELKVLCAIGFYAVGSYQRPHGHSYDLNLSQTMVSRSISEVTAAINHPDVLTHYIRFPCTHLEREAVIARNDRMGMPRTLGYIDGTLVSIVPPAGERQAYRTRKGFTGLNVQIVCDADLNILNVNSRFPGSATDSHIYNFSVVQRIMRTAYEESRCWLLGDSGYPFQPWLMLPLPHAPPNTPAYHYTRLHCHCRNCVERCIGVLKARWRCLLKDRTLHYDPAKCGAIVNACAVLHNYLNRLRAPLPPPVFEDLGADPLDEVDFDNIGLDDEADIVRNFLIEHAHNVWQQRHAQD